MNDKRLTLIESYLVVLAQIEKQHVEVVQIQVEPFSYPLGRFIEVSENI